MAETDDTGELDSSPAGVPDRPADRAPDQPADTTSDKRAAELDIGWGERHREPDQPSEEDERLIRERPPHWE